MRRNTGGAPFDVADLHAVLAVGPVILALDGLDEVVDLGDRSEIVTGIERAVERLSEVCDSLQVVVTSRPASFTGARLPVSRFHYLRLTDLTPSLIAQYRDQWADARSLAADEIAELTGVLDQKLEQPHFRDLARNPMQLAILLGLIHRKGPALPDQRTELYHSYMENFLDREAAKSKAVRDHRQLLLLLHGHLAWQLHAEAEKSPRSGGRISGGELVNTAEDFLQQQGYDQSLFSDLMGEAFDRFGALVSRVEGTFEFEVQPLREYFAALYLYKTAPHSRAGREQPGTRLDRFEAMVRRPLWLNVVRFYAGFYDAGELGSLADGLEELAADPLFAATGLPRTVAAQLLSDRTFAQARKARVRAAAVVTAGLGERHGGAGESYGWRSYLDQQFTLPERNGAEELFGAATRVLESGVSSSRALAVARLARRHAPASTVAEWWMGVARKRRGECLEKWFAVGRVLDVLGSVDRDDLVRLVDGTPSPQACYALMWCGMWSIFDRDTAWAEAAEAYVLEHGPLWLPSNDQARAHPLAALAGIVDAGHDVLQEETSYYVPARDWVAPSPTQNGLYARARALGRLYETVRPGTGVRWSRAIAPWDALVEEGRRRYGEQPAWNRLAVIASGVRDLSDRGGGHADLYDQSKSLCRRARFARHRTRTCKWWETRVREAPSREERLFVMALWANWADASVIGATREMMEQLLGELDQDELHWLVSTVATTQRLFEDTGKGQRRLRNVFAGALPSVRLFVALLPRLHRADAHATYRAANYAISPAEVALLPYLAGFQASRSGGEREDWDDTLRLMRTAESVDAVDVPVLLGAGRMPVSVARVVVDAAHEYPLDLVGVAEFALLGAATKQAGAVGAVAEREKWFSVGM